MQCSKETLIRLFYNVSISFQLLFIFFYLSSILLAKFYSYISNISFLQRNQDEYEYVFSDEEEEEDNGYYHSECTDENNLVDEDDTTCGGEALPFLPTKVTRMDQPGQGMVNPCKPMLAEPNQSLDSDQLSYYSSPPSESEYESEEGAEEEDNTGRDSGIVTTEENHDGKYVNDENGNEDQVANFTRDEKFLIFQPPRCDSRKMKAEEGKENEEVFGDSCTVGSTSKSSSEWRSSINFRDSGTEDPFSSSSRRSCPKWESYTVFQKYDEEMLFLDRISAQKLHETESLRSIQTCPRSISERIVLKLGTINKKPTDHLRRNPYHELEGAYVAQICLTWEALNWNYNYFHRLRATRRDSDPGCPAYIAQQFQQFQVLLQRYVENEPYEHGRRPEIYARMRSLAPKLLQVPEYRDSDDEKKEEGYIVSRIGSDTFVRIMEEAIRTFMNFLKADKQNHCQILTSFFKRNRRPSVDPTLLLLLKKVNKKKKMKVKDLRRSRKCLRKRRLKEEEEMEILLALIDLKVVSRVLRMKDLSDEQLHWCEDKLTKVRVSDGKLRRDSSPLFFPAH
ncbi:hypothetical protein LguiA_027916 [Lonicera macranthoides]